MGGLARAVGDPDGPGHGRVLAYAGYVLFFEVLQFWVRAWRRQKIVCLDAEKDAVGHTGPGHEHLCHALVGVVLGLVGRPRVPDLRESGAAHLHAVTAVGAHPVNDRVAPPAGQVGVCPRVVCHLVPAQPAEGAHVGGVFVHVLAVKVVRAWSLFL